MNYTTFQQAPTPTQALKHSGAVGGGVPVHKESPVFGALGTQEAFLNELHDAITRLEGRLDPVLTPSNEADSAGADAPTSPTSLITGRIGINTDLVRRAIVRVNRLSHLSEL